MLTGSLGSGKTVASLTFALANAPSIFVCDSYPAVDELLKDIQRLFGTHLNRITIVKPEGQLKACRTPGCRHNKIWNPPGIVGIVTKERVPQDYCAYASLLAISNQQANLVITHHAVLRAGVLDKGKSKTLVIDECDDFLRIHDFVLVRYSGERATHLNIEGNNLEDAFRAFEFIGKQPPYKDRERSKAAVSNSKNCSTLLGQMCRNLADIPELEADNVEEIKHSSRPTKAELLAGIMTADDGIKNAVAGMNTVKFLRQFKRTLAKFVVADFRSLPPDLHENAMNFWNIGQNAMRFYFVSRKPSQSSPNGYREVRMEDELEDATLGFRQTLLVSATPVTSLKEQTVTVSLEDDENANKILFLLLTNPSLLRRLVVGLSQRFNLLGVTTSKSRLELAIRKLGGFNIGDTGDIEALRRDLVSRKGALVWNYYRSGFSKSVNYLEVLDGVVVADWISRELARIEANPELHRITSLSNLIQMLGRVLRPGADHKFRSKFVIVLDPSLLELLRLSYSHSVFVKTSMLDDALEQINEFAEPMTVRPKFVLQREMIPRAQSVGRNPRTGKRYSQRYLKIPLPKAFPNGKARITIESLE